ncbi:MAG TPA: hypothetical protein VKU82_09465 [Planctomycetaceae bacterium]|nr:hypothetical protein [Planctomycetaceae bacterium]
METRFAGSQRLGDRRRRRLAADADDVPLDSQRIALPAPPGASRLIDAARTDARVRVASFERALPLANLIPHEWWKYALGGAACLSIGGAIVVAGWYERAGTLVLGPGVSRLFAFPAAPAATWFSSLLLLASSQLAILIWWGRSHSNKDFEGRYWVWVRVACAWLGFGACIATSAHLAVCDTLAHFWPGIGARHTQVGWLAPAAAVGIWIMGALSREMKGCRSSRAFLFAAAGCYAFCGGLCLELHSVVSSSAHLFFINTVVLVGHVSLFLSMWLHARHVLYRTPDPAAQSKRTWTFGIPHFRLLRVRFPRPGRGENESAPPKKAPIEPASRRKRPPKKDGSAAPAGEDHRAKRSVSPAERATMKNDTGATGENGPDPRSRETVPQGGQGSECAVTARGDAALSPEDESAPEEAPVPFEATTPERDAADSGPDSSLPKPDLKGLSKKQRRRLMQDLRDRERSAGR